MMTGAPSRLTWAPTPWPRPIKTLQADVGNLYGPLKALSEAEAQRQFGAETTIIRPGLIVGPGDETDRFTYWPVRLARGGEVLAPGDGSDPVQFIDARDLAEWTIRMAEMRAFGVFNATGPTTTLTMKAMLESVGQGGAVHRPSQLGAGRLPGRPEDQRLERHAGLDPGPGRHRRLCARRSIDHALAAGLTFRPLPTTAADTLAWFQTQPADRQAELKAGLTPEREADLLARLKAQKN